MSDEYNHCKICGTPIPSDIIRCKDCDKAWQAGYKKGYDVRSYEILKKFNEIFGGGECQWCVRSGVKPGIMVSDRYKKENSD